MSISVTLLCSPAARQTFEQALDLPEGATVSEAVLASGLDGQFPALDWRALTPGVWGKVVGWDRVLQQDDRLEQPCVAGGSEGRPTRALPAPGKSRRWTVRPSARRRESRLLALARRRLPAP